MVVGRGLGSLSCPSPRQRRWSTLFPEFLQAGSYRGNRCGRSLAVRCSPLHFFFPAGHRLSLSDPLFPCALHMRCPPSSRACSRDVVFRSDRSFPSLPLSLFSPLAIRDDGILFPVAVLLTYLIPCSGPSGEGGGREGPFSFLSPFSNFFFPSPFLILESRNISSPGSLSFPSLGCWRWTELLHEGVEDSPDRGRA